jgi:hypothetical protein
VDEHVLAAVIADDEAEPFLRVEEFDDALGLADDLRRHSAATAAAAAATETSAASAASAAIAATTAEAATVATAAATTAETSAITIAATATAATATATAAASLLETATEITCEILFAEAFALIPTATSAVSFAPSIETHIRPNFICPLTPQTNALGQKGATGHGA